MNTISTTMYPAGYTRPKTHITPDDVKRYPDVYTLDPPPADGVHPGFTVLGMKTWFTLTTSARDIIDTLYPTPGSAPEDLVNALYRISNRFMDGEGDAVKLLEEFQEYARTA